MAGIFTDVYRIVKPSSPKAGYTYADPDDMKLYSNVSWYTKVMKGASSRFSKYQQYKSMDFDVFVARALDTIAEEMCQIDVKTNLPFEIVYQNEATSEVPEHIVSTVRAALRHWCHIQGFSNNLFDIARQTIKNGDCFFTKVSDFKKWKHIEPQDVIGVSIGKESQDIDYYQMRSSNKNVNGAYGDMELTPAAGVIHFSLSSNMGGELGPFGESVLAPAIKAYRHISLLEDAVIIYRIVRAPERRVFTIDVGNMPPQRARAYLESIKNDMRQKRVPNDMGGTDKVDSVYNPMCLTLDTEIPLLDGRTVELNQLIKEHTEGKQNWVYSTNPETGNMVPGLVSWAGVTRKNAETIIVTLDNGKQIKCTPDHKFPTLNRGFVEAKDLLPTDSLISFETEKSEVNGDEVEYVYNHETHDWEFTHHTVAKFFKGLTKHQEFTFSPEYIGAEKNIVLNRKEPSNNHPANLTWMNEQDYILYQLAKRNDMLDQIKSNPSDIDNLNGSVELYNNQWFFKESVQVKVVSITQGEIQDTGCITVDGDHKYHDYHTFALASGVYTKNSMNEDFFFTQTADGRGSKVDTLPGGENLGIVTDLFYFQKKFLEGLRIPSSYMSGAADSGSMVQDGKVGVAYIEELRFANYVARLQSKLNPTFDKQFKAYLKSAGINVSHDLFQIKLNDPQNFKIYKQAEVDEKLISNFNSIKDVKTISKRYALMHYLGWSEDDLQTNEAMLKQELAIPEGGIAERLNELRMIYDDKWIDGKPEIKVDDSYEDFTAQTKKVVPKETPPEEETESTGSEEMDQPEGGESEAPEKVEEPATPEEGGEETKEEPTPDLKDIESDIKGKE